MLPTVTDTNIENISRHHWNYPIISTKVSPHRDSSTQSTSKWPFDNPTDQPECPYLHHQPMEKSSQLQNPHDRTRQQLPPNVTGATYPCSFLPRWCHKRHQPAVPTSLIAKNSRKMVPDVWDVWGLHPSLPYRKPHPRRDTQTVRTQKARPHNGWCPTESILGTVGLEKLSTNTRRTGYGRTDMVTYHRIFASHRLDIEINNELKIELNLKHDESVYA